MEIDPNNLSGSRYHIMSILKPDATTTVRKPIEQDIYIYQEKGGIAGFHGCIARIIGWVLEKIFHKTVRVEASNGIYYLNCQSIANWFQRIGYVSQDMKIHDREWVKAALEGIVAEREKDNYKAPPKQEEADPAKANQEATESTEGNI